MNYTKNWDKKIDDMVYNWDTNPVEEKGIKSDIRALLTQERTATVKECIKKLEEDFDDLDDVGLVSIINSLNNLIGE